ncbi:hypothetical protein [Lacticaseibacillus sp. GG6-2]
MKHKLDFTLQDDSHKPSKAEEAELQRRIAEREAQHPEIKRMEERVAKELL